jgi:hypothetical protein
MRLFMIDYDLQVYVINPLLFWINRVKIIITTKLKKYPKNLNQ